MDDIYEKSEENNQIRSEKLMIFDDLIGYVISNKRQQKTVTESFPGVFITKSYLSALNNDRRTHYVVIKNLNKRDVQQIAINR